MKITVPASVWCAILVAFLAFPSGRTYAQEPAQKTEDLRYDGKSFEQWRLFIRTELKVENRAEAFKAFAAFADNGYAKDATSAILEAVRKAHQHSSKPTWTPGSSSRLLSRP